MRRVFYCGSSAAAVRRITKDVATRPLDIIRNAKLMTEVKQP